MSGEGGRNNSFAEPSRRGLWERFERRTVAGRAELVGMATEATDAGPRAAVPVELRRERRLVCVEYPGVVRDVTKMLHTLGGEEGVSRVRGWESPGRCGRGLAVGLRPKGREHLAGTGFLGNEEWRGLWGGQWAGL